MPKIFISYSREDGESITKLVSELNDLGYDVLLDKKHLRGGHSTVEEIQEKIQQSEYFVPLITNNALRSPWVGPVEIKWARRLQKEGHRLRIVPVLLKKVRSNFRDLAGLNYVDFTENYSIGLARLLQALPSTGYDELYHLRSQLDERKVEDRSLLTILRRAATKKRKSGKSINWSTLSAQKFMARVRRILKVDESADEAYWWLIVHGVLKFRDITKWYDEEHYADSAKYAQIAPRGVALMNELRTEIVSKKRVSERRRPASSKAARR